MHASLLDGPDDEQLTYKSIRQAVEAKLGLPVGALKTHKEELKEIINRINDEGPDE